MFPSARSSMRRTSTSSKGGSGRVNKTMPVPAAVHLFNLMADFEPNQRQQQRRNGGDGAHDNQPQRAVSVPTPPSSSSKKWYRPEHTMRLLKRVTLQIVAVTDGDVGSGDNIGASVGVDDNDNGHGESGQMQSADAKAVREPTPAAGTPSATTSTSTSKTRVIYSCLASTPSANPTWEHIDERMQLPAKWWNGIAGEELYKCMRLRLCVLPPLAGSNQNETSPPTFEAASASGHVPTSIPTTTESATNHGHDYAHDHAYAHSQQQSTILVEMPLHPSMLKKLDQMPPSFPPNACIVHFTDGSTRCLPSLYQLLLDQRVLDDSGKDEVEEFLRFEDDAFRMLDTVPAVGSDSSRDDGDVDDDGNGNGDDRNVSDSNTIDSDVGNRGMGVPHTVDSGGAPIISEEGVGSRVIQGSHRGMARNDDGNGNDEEEKKEEEALLRAIAREEEAIANRLATIQHKKTALQALARAIERSSKENTFIDKEARLKNSKLHQDSIKCATVQMRLLAELRTIYPVRVQHDHRNASRDQAESSGTAVEQSSTIRGLRLPAMSRTHTHTHTQMHATSAPNTTAMNINMAAVPEDEASAALGFTCHLVVLVSKYLSVPLRYRIICNSSRSGIMLDQRTMLPLFIARGVDREHLGRGMMLLNSNVDCIVSSRGISQSYHPARRDALMGRSTDILGKLDAVFCHALSNPSIFE